MTAPTTQQLRCAVYTRKSSEEGLEQAFNSLDAQREAGMAYIASQKHEGWTLIRTHYDDGGYSGGSTERPALQKLLADIESGKIDIIVVYKVDRLSRSLGDFAQMMNLFDKHNVSFVSVTQQFNTTTSMGRLTLNILLSFAQFEREVTGERIRDKFAASKKKGMWMGGTPPLGYFIKDRQLIIDEKEAELVKKIFTLYLGCKSPLAVMQTLQQEGHTNKRWQTVAGQWRGGQKMTAGHVNRILRNVVYVGKVKHGKENYPGQHLPIIDEVLWDQVQESINHQQRESRYQWRSHFLLQGKLKTHEGFLMSPYTHQKAALSQVGKKPRYYASRKALTKGYAQCPIKSLNADLLEDLITSQVFHYLVEHNKPVYEFVTRMTDENRKVQWIRDFVESVVIGPELMVITLSRQAIATTENDISNNPFDGGNDDNATVPPVIWYQPDIREEEDKTILSLSILIRRINGVRAILSSSGKDLTLPAQPKPDSSVVQAIGRGFRWKQMLNENPKLSFKQFEAKVGYCDSFITKQISLIGLAPDILHRALTGTLPPSIKLNRLYEAATSLSWERQRQLLDLN